VGRKCPPLLEMRDKGLVVDVVLFKQYSGGCSH